MQSKQRSLVPYASTLAICVGLFSFCKEIYLFLVYSLDAYYLPRFLCSASSHLNVGVFFLAYWLIVAGVCLEKKKRKTVFIAAVLFWLFWICYYIGCLVYQEDGFYWGRLAFFFPTHGLSRILFYVDAALSLWIVTTSIVDRLIATKGRYFLEKYLPDKAEELTTIEGALRNTYEAYVEFEDKMLSRNKYFLLLLIAVFVLVLILQVDYDRLFAESGLLYNSSRSSYYLIEALKRANKAFDTVEREHCRSVVVTGSCISTGVREEMVDEFLDTNGRDCRLFNFGVGGTRLEVQGILVNLAADLKPDMIILMLNVWHFDKTDPQILKSARRIFFNTTHLYDGLPVLESRCHAVDKVVTFYLYKDLLNAYAERAFRSRWQQINKMLHMIKADAFRVLPSNNSPVAHETQPVQSESHDNLLEFLDPGIQIHTGNLYDSLLLADCELTDERLHLLHGITDSLDAKGIDYRLVYAPSIPFTNYENSVTKEAELVRSVEKNAEMWIKTLSTDPRYSDKFINLKNRFSASYFLDYFHLTDPGLESLSEEIGRIASQ